MLHDGFEADRALISTSTNVPSSRGTSAGARAAGADASVAAPTGTASPLTLSNRNHLTRYDVGAAVRS